MARLTSKARKALPAKDFALGKGHYPIENASHARNALARVSEFGSPAQKAKVRAKVHAKYPDMGHKDADGDHDGHKHPQSHNEFIKLGAPKKGGKY